MFDFLIENNSLNQIRPIAGEKRHFGVLPWKKAPSSTARAVHLSVLFPTRILINPTRPCDWLITHCSRSRPITEVTVSQSKRRRRALSEKECGK